MVAGPDPARTPVRSSALSMIERPLEALMIVLSLVWIALVIYQLTVAQSVVVDRISTAIWGVFIADLLVRLAMAPNKTLFLKRNWLLVVALVLPGFRGLAIMRFFGFARFLPLLRLSAAVNRGMGALGHTLGRSGAGYVFGVIVLVAFAGAAGMDATEGFSRTGQGFSSFWDALWWTAMTLTTMGAAYSPHTALGRTVCLILAIFGFSTFGYVTAVFAKFLMQEKPGPDSLSAQLSELREEIRALSASMGAGTQPQTVVGSEHRQTQASRMG